MVLSIGSDDESDVHYFAPWGSTPGRRFVEFNGSGGQRLISDISRFSQQKGNGGEGGIRTPGRAFDPTTV